MIGQKIKLVCVVPKICFHNLYVIEYIFESEAFLHAIRVCLFVNFGFCFEDSCEMRTIPKNSNSVPETRLKDNV